MKKQKIIICSIVLVSFLLLTGVSYNYLKYKRSQKLIENNIRYAEIKKAVNKEMERYHYVVFPTCDEENTSFQRISDGDLICNGGMDREYFLDVDGKNYCDTLTYATCVETDKWEFKTYIRCKDHKDDKFVDWDGEGDYCP